MQPELIGNAREWLLLAIALLVLATVAWMGYEMGRRAAEREHQPQASSWQANGDPTAHGR